MPLDVGGPLVRDSSMRIGRCPANVVWSGLALLPAGEFPRDSISNGPELKAINDLMAQANGFGPQDLSQDNRATVPCET